VLFLPGGTVLSEGGIALLDRILPDLQRIGYPLLVAGHTAVRRDEEENAYAVSLDSSAMDSTWPLSYHRALAVYRHLSMRGIDPGRLSLEAFGQFHPRYSNNTPEGRRKNRRVDLVLDKRNREWIEKVEALREQGAPPREMYYKGFRFDLTLPGDGSQEGNP
jgi:chemotaxis protein MotB